MDTFSLGLLVGLVAGAWLTVIYYIIVTRCAAIRALVRKIADATVHNLTRPAPQTTLDQPVKTAPPVSRYEQQKSAPQFDPESLSSTGTALYHQLVSLTHDQQTAERLIMGEQERHPDRDIETDISYAIDRLVRDRRV